MKNDDAKKSPGKLQQTSTMHKNSDKKNTGQKNKITTDKQKQLDKLTALEQEAAKLKAKEFRTAKTSLQTENADLVADKSVASMAQQETSSDEAQVASESGVSDEIILEQLNPQEASQQVDSVEVAEVVNTDTVEVESESAEIAQAGQRIGKGGGVTTPVAITFDITNGIKGGILTGGLIATSKSKVPDTPDFNDTFTVPHNTNTPDGNITPTGTAQHISQLSPQLTPGQVPDKVVQQTPDPTLPPQLKPVQVPDKVVQQTPDPTLPPQLTPGQVPDKVVQQTPDPTLPPQLTPGQVPDKVVQQTPDPTLPPQLTPGKVPDKVVQQTPDPTLPPQLTPGKVPYQVPQAIPNAIPTAVPDKIPQPMHQEVPLAAAITIDAITKDNIVNALEAKANVDITGHVGGDVIDGDVITLTVNGHTYSGQVSGSTFTIAVMGSDLSADNNVQAQVTVKNIDGRTLTASDGQTYKIDTQVNATDDTNTAIEDQAANATSGNVLTNDDQDGTQVTTTDVTGTYGVFHFKADGSYTYELDNSKVQHLNVNDHVTDTVPYSVTDGAGNQTTANIAVNIVGTNDAAVITGDSTADLTEDNLIHGAGNYLYTQGKLSRVDVDNPDATFQKESLSVDVNGQPTIGNLMINDKGLWTYNIDNTKIQNLGDGESLIERFVVHSIDGTAHEVIATVHGQTDVPAAIVVNVPNLAPILAPNLIPIAVPHQVPNALVQHVPATATISINDLTTDNTVNSLEAGQQVHVTGKVNGDVHDGDLVSLSVNGQSYSGKANGGTFDILVNGSDLSADNSIKAEVTGTSGTGDTCTVTVAHAYSVDTVVDATDDVNTAIEDQNANATSGNVLTNDDQDGTQVTTTDVTGTYGVFHFKADGSYTYELDNSKVQHLTTQDKVDDLVSYSITDAAGNSTTATLTVAITGSDDAAIITDVQNNLNLRGVTEDRGYIDTHYNLHYDGKLNIQDPDQGEGAFDPNIGSQTYQGIGYDTKLGGHILLMQDGHYTYTLDNRNIQNLAEGEIKQDSAVIRSADGTTHTIELTVHGTNDTPTIAAQSHTVIEGGNLLHGQMIGQDIDTGAQLHYSTPQIDGLTFNPDGSYSFDPSHLSYQSIASGVTKTLTIPITVTDEHHASSTQNLSITITGANNAASISGVSTGDVDEGHGSYGDMSPDYAQPGMAKLGQSALTADGKLDIVDPDSGEAQFDPKGGAWNNSYHGQYGHLLLNTDGTWHYDVTVGSVDWVGNRKTTIGTTIDQLGEGQTLTDTITVYSKDGTSQDIVITIHGDNDRPYISSEVTLANGTEDTALTFSKADLLANTVDVDANDAGKLSIANLIVDNGSVVDNKDGTYTFTPTKDYNGQVHFSYDVTDAHGGITHTGASTVLTTTPDGAIISEVTTSQVIEDGSHSFNGQHLKKELAIGKLQIIDPDSGENQFHHSQFGETAIHDPFGGMLHIDSAGNWRYSVNNAALQHLAQGQTETVVYRVHSYDGTAYELHIDVVGSNDAPTVNQVALSNGTEDTHYQMQASQFGFTDIDTGDSLHAIAITDLPPASQGKFVLDGHDITAGQSIATADISKLQFVPAKDFNGDVQFKYTVNDGHADSAKASNTLHISPVNDAATIDGQTQSNSSAAITEDSTTSVISGHLTIVDPDAGEDKFVANTHIDGQYGQLTVDENGSWHYVLNNTATVVNGLNAGQQLTDTIKVNSPDGTASETISITIHGHTDTPSLQLQEAGAVQGLNLFAGIQGNGVSQLQYSTDGVNFSNQIPAGFSLASDGHTLEVDPANGSYDHLANGIQHKVWINYQLQEGTGSNAHQSSQQAQVIITGTSDAPVIHGFTANSDQYSGPVTGNLLQGATDVDDGAQLILQDLQFKDPTTQHYVSVHTGQDFNIKGVGHITIASDGNYTFTPEANFSGDVPEFIYRVVDTHGDYKDESQNTLKIHIDANHQPTVQTLTASTAEETDYQFSAASFGYQDADGDAMAELTITQLPDPTNGHLLLNGQTITQGQAISSNDIGKLIFKPAANFNGDAHFRYVTNDGHQDSAAHTAVLTVTAVNDLPVLTINQTSHTQGNLVATDVDTGDTHTFSAPVLTGSFGSLSVDPDSGAYIYTQNNSVAHMTYNPATSTYSGVDVFEVQVSDNHGGMASQFISFTAQATLSSTAGTVVITSSVPTQPVITNTLPSTNVVATALTNNVSIDLSAASDSGSVDNDNLTNDITPTIVGHTDMPFSRVTIYDGNTTVGHTLSDASGDYSVTLSGLSEGLHNLSAKALAPSSTVPTVSSGLDVQIDTQVSTSIQVDPITADNVINAQESHSDVNVTGQVGGDAQLGDIVTLTLNQHSYTGTVDSNGQFSIQVAGAELASNSAISASVSTTDKAGNSAQASQVLHYDTDLQAGRPSITFENPGSDNLYSKAEIAHGHADTITATVHAAADAKAGEHLNINGVDHILDTNSLANGISLEVAPSSIIKAIMTDEHGNVNSALNMAASAKPEPIVVTAPSGSHHIAATLGVPTITPSQTPVPVDQQGWKILVNGHYQTSYSSHWGTLTINPKTGELNYQEHANTHTGPHGSAPDVGVHEDRFEVALQGSHHDDVVMHVQVSILSHGPGHSGKLTLGSEVLDMTVTPTFNHPAPPPPPPVDAYDEPQSDAKVELSVGISDIVIDDEAQAQSNPEAIPTTQAETAVDSTAANAPVDHYLQMVGISQQQLAPKIENAMADGLPAMQELASTGSDADMLDTNQVDVFASPLEDDDKHGLNHDHLSVLDDLSEHQVIDPINDDDSLHQALNDMHSQI